MPTLDDLQRRVRAFTEADITSQLMRQRFAEEQARRAFSPQLQSISQQLTRFHAANPNLQPTDPVPAELALLRQERDLIRSQIAQGFTPFSAGQAQNLLAQQAAEAALRRAEAMRAGSEAFKTFQEGADIPATREARVGGIEAEAAQRQAQARLFREQAADIPATREARIKEMESKAAQLRALESVIAATLGRVQQGQLAPPGFTPTPVLRPQPFINVDPGQVVFDPNTGQQVFQSPVPPPSRVGSDLDQALADIASGRDGEQPAQAIDQGQPSGGSGAGSNTGTAEINTDRLMAPMPNTPLRNSPDIARQILDLAKSRNPNATPQELSRLTAELARSLGWNPE